MIQLEKEKKNFCLNIVENDDHLKSILISWMVEVQNEFKFNTQTLYLAVNYVHRCLVKVQTPRSALQLLGITALFIAAKYEETIPPLIEKFIEICDFAYTIRQILSMEYHILNCLSFDLTCDTIINFINFFLKVLDINEQYPEIYFLCHYLGELTLPINEFRKYLPSKIAASIVIFSVYAYQNPNTNIKTWINEFENISKYKMEELLSCIQLLLNNIEYPKEPKFIVEKYSQPEFGCISTKIANRNLNISKLC